jgi:hypothetical protein
MTAILSQIVLEHRSGLPEDRVVNNLAWAVGSTGLPSSTDLENLTVDISNFYNVVPSGHNALAGFIAPCISRTAFASKIKWYDLTGHLDGSAHGSPFATTEFTLSDAVSGAQGLPSEVAVCMSFRAGYGSDPEFAGSTRPRARDRGRIFLGPLTKSVCEEVTNSRVRVSQSFRETVIDRAEALIASTTGAWSVWSRAAGTLDPVVAAWVDDAFDTQRRRGEAPQGRLQTTP